jgi:hypothetical protein
MPRKGAWPIVVRYWAVVERGSTGLASWGWDMLNSCRWLLEAGGQTERRWLSGSLQQRELLGRFQGGEDALAPVKCVVAAVAAVLGGVRALRETDVAEPGPC